MQVVSGQCQLIFRRRLLVAFGNQPRLDFQNGRFGLLKIGPGLDQRAFIVERIDLDQQRALFNPGAGFCRIIDRYDFTADQ